MVSVSFSPLVQRTKPYLVATDMVLSKLNLSPAGVDISDELVINPQVKGNAPFLKMLRRLDELTFAPLGMPMPDWVFYDCAVMPGAVFGVCVDAKDLEPWVKAVMNIEADYEGPVPVSMFIAIPMLEEHSWFVYTLCDINMVAPGAAPSGVLQFTMGLGLQVFPLQRLYGTLQWRSTTVRDIVRLGAIELVTAYTPAHSYRRTFTYRVDLDQNKSLSVLSDEPLEGGVPVATHLLDVDNEELLLRLQKELEENIRWEIVGAPFRKGAYTQIPLRRLGKGGEGAWT